MVPPRPPYGGAVPHPLVLAAGSLLDSNASTIVGAAAAAGFDGVGLRISGQHAVTEPNALRGWAEGLGVSIHDVEVYRIGTDAVEPMQLIERAAALDASALLVVSDLSDRGATIRRVAELTERCHAHGLELGLEYMAWTDPSSPLDAIEVAQATGCRLIVDVLHHTRVGAGVDEFDAIVASGTLGWVQLCDAPLAPPDDRDLLREARHGRLPPGQGELPLRELLARVPDGVVVSVEVQSDALAAIGLVERARLLHDTARSVLVA